MDLADPGELNPPIRHEPNAIELALVAALVSPKLAERRPEEAVEIARKLLSAGQENIDRLFHKKETEKAKERQSEVKLHERDQRMDSFFENEKEQVLIEDAFERWPSGYKTLKGFATALREAYLLQISPAGRGNPLKGKAFTTEQAVVDELARWKKERERKRNREAKRAAREKFDKITRNSERKNGNAETKSGNPNRKSGKADSKKRTRPRPR